MAKDLKFKGTFDELKDRLAPLQLDGKWADGPNGVKMFKGTFGSNIHWSETQGTIWCDGPDANPLRNQVQAALKQKPAVKAPLAPARRTIYLVYGRGASAGASLNLDLRKLTPELRVVRIKEGDGRPLIDELAQASADSYAVILLAKDDYGYSASDDASAAKPRPSQHVMLATGILLARLKAGHCILLCQGGLSLPSLPTNVSLISYPQRIAKTAREELLRRLADVGAGTLGK